MIHKDVLILSSDYLDFKDEITARIRFARYEALKAVNRAMTALYWEILIAEISWSKYIIILSKCKDTQQRYFYILVTSI